MKLPVPPPMPSPPATPNWVELADLKVQQQLAEIAQQMMWLTVGQLLLAIFGTIALIVTLRESRRATATAMKALHVQQSAERAVLVVESQSCEMVYRPYRMDGDPAGELIIKGAVISTVKIENAGPSIGFLKRTALWIQYGDEPSTVGNDDQIIDSRHVPLDPGEIFTLSAEVEAADTDDTNKLTDGFIPCWFHGYVEYEDLFGESHRIGFAYRTVDEIRMGEIAEFGDDAFWKSY